jgi:catechol 2,3-dioxygenase-like lactoylglutathione lyase family enzyme
MSTAKRLNHVHVLVNDLERAIAFYTHAFGLTHAYTDIDDGHSLAFLHIDGTDDVLTLHSGSDKPVERGGLQHFGFRVEGSLDAAIAAVEEAGGEFVERAGWNPNTVAYVRDPDGYVVEVFAEN